MNNPRLLWPASVLVCFTTFVFANGLWAQTAAGGGNGAGFQGNGGVLFVPRVMPIPRLYGGIPHVTVRTPIQYRQTVARNFFFAGGVNLGTAPTPNTAANPAPAANTPAAPPAPVRWVPRQTSPTR